MPTVAITMDLSCCRCRSKIEKILCSIQERGKFVFDKVVYEKDKVLITGSFDAIELCCKLRCKAGCFVIKIEIVIEKPPPPPPPKCCEKDPCCKKDPKKCCKKDPKKCCKKDPKCCKEEEPKCKQKQPKPVVVDPPPPNPVVDCKKPEPIICNKMFPFPYPYPCPYNSSNQVPRPCCECHICKPPPPCPKPPPVCPPHPCPPPPCPQPPCPPPPICYPQPPCPRPPCPCPPWTPCQCHCRYQRDYCCEQDGSCAVM